MKGEINKGFYCTGNYYNHGYGGCILFEGECNNGCNKRHRKWPTPEQFKEEYGEDWSDDGAVYAFDEEKCEWRINTYFAAKHCNLIAICACTPFGMPDND
ncbi:MAG: hypothetical protein LBH43_11220 [Treponema sp.]|jgi:hypothetical protein|nr:hypothetical protein [Treponema sp.]